VDATCIDPNASQPVPRRTNRRVRLIGELRLPLAGPYRPRARLYLLPDGRLVWTVRLWDVDRPVCRTFSTATLRRFARRSRLVATEQEIDALVHCARAVALRDPR
jgi:hypothetical protein